VLAEQWLDAHIDRATKRVIEVGGADYSLSFLPTASHTLLTYSPDLPVTSVGRGQIRGDLTVGTDPLVRESADVIILTQVLAFTQDPELALRSLLDLLAPGGCLIGTEPFLSPVSLSDAERWGDYWRLTPQGIARLAYRAGFSEVAARILGNPRLAGAFILGISSEEVPSEWWEVSESVSHGPITGYVARREALSGGGPTHDFMLNGPGSNQQ